MGLALLLAFVFHLGVAAVATAIVGTLPALYLAWVVVPAARKPGRWLSLVPAVPGWVDRGELAEVVSALTAAGSGAVALTTGLVGAGGFGKTTLAAKACQDRKVQRLFRGGIVWITVGRDTDGPGLAARISEVIATADGDSGRAFTRPEQAGQALAGALSGSGRTLLVVDDVWTAAQLQPFAAAGQPCRLLVTTRRPAVLADVADPRQIKVDAMPDPVARRLLTRGLPAMAAGLERDLLDLTGRWPLLLNLVNHRLAGDVDRGAHIDTAAAAAAGRLRERGPAALDITDSGQRQTAVAATVGYSLDALDSGDRDRFFELGIFAEDAEVPLSAVALLWQGTAGLSAAAAESLCERLDGLSLLTLAWAGEVRVMVLHDVIRDFALSRLGPAGQAGAHAALISAARPVTGPGAAPGALPRNGEGGGTAWWRLPETPGCGYLWEYLTYHLQAAGLGAELDEVCGDLRFLAVRLRRSGPAAVEADLARSGSPIAGRLRRVVVQNAHLLGPAEPPAAVITTFTSRLGGIPELASQLPALRSGLRAWTAWPSWPPPDLPSDALIRVLTGHRGLVTAVAIAPDGTWLATAGTDGTVRTWAADGTPRATLTGHDGGVSAVAIAPDGTWLATAGNDGTVRTWAADGTPRATLTGHGWVIAVAIAPDGTWLATAGDDGTARIWAADGTPRATLTGHDGWVSAVAIAPDGTWLATAGERRDGADLGRGRHPPRHPHRPRRPGARGGDRPGRDLAGHRRRRDGTARIWAADGTPRATLTGHDGPVHAVAIAPDGTWLATAGDDGTVRTWAADGTPRATLTGHRGSVFAVAIAPDGTWLATGGDDGTVRIWAADGTPRATLTGHDGSVFAVAIAPDGTWLATAGDDGTARTWAADGTPRATLTGHDDSVFAVAIAPDGTWLATAGSDGTVRTWAADGTPRATLTGHDGSVSAVAIAPDGTWLATAGSDGTVRTWAADGTPRATLTGHDGSVYAVAIAPDGTWLATAGSDGTARTWAADGTPRATLTGHDDPVYAVAIAPDGTWLATASIDGTVRTWAADGTPRATLTGHDDLVSAVAIAPDGTWLATAGTDRTVRIWAVGGAPSSGVTAIRVDGDVSGCAWFPGSTDLCIGGNRGLYRFSLRPPAT